MKFIILFLAMTVVAVAQIPQPTVFKSQSSFQSATYSNNVITIKIYLSILP